MTLRVAVNAVSLLSPFTGVAHYTRCLMREIVARPDIECFFFYGYGWERSLRDSGIVGITQAKSLFKSLVPRSHDIARFVQQLRFGTVKRFGVDVYHEPNYFPFKGVERIVTTIHDLSPIRFPQTHSKENLRLWRRLPDALARSRVLITDSEFVRKEIMELYGVGPDRIHAIPLGVGDTFRNVAPEAVAAALRARGLEMRRYVLAVGTLEPRKNLVGTLKAYRALPEAVARRFPLAIAGQRGWLATDIEAEIARLEALGLVRRLGYVTDEELACLYAGARAFVYPSLYEGFGLPVLEAMACGAPVISSNKASLPEVVGEAGIQIEPEDTVALRDALCRLIEDERECERLIALGRARSARFTWANCAGRTVEVYRSMLR